MSTTQTKKTRTMSGDDEAYSIDLEDTSVRSSSSSDAASSSSSRRSSAWSDVGSELDWKGRISLLTKLKERMETNELFDDQDVSEVEQEIERVEEQERNSFETRLKERLRILAKFDGYLSFRKHHPNLNAYFVKKQKKMQKLAQRAAKKG